MGKAMRVVLVNTNRMKPPIAPIGLEYVAEALNAAGYRVEVLDLCWAEDWKTAVADFFNTTNADLVGMTLRNTDDCVFTSRQSFLTEFADIADTIREYTDALIVLGGVGFSVMPEAVLSLCNADAGVWRDGEFALVDLVKRIQRKQEWRDVPNVIWRRDGTWHRNQAATSPLDGLPLMGRRWIDNQRYFREGGQAGIEMKRGCDRHCIHCADPVAKGKKIRVRPPKAVADELESLLAQGIDYIHTCDSEFNLPEWHAVQVCQEIIRRNLGGKLRWYAYCSPIPFSLHLATLMHRAGCVGINFGVDNGDEAMLRRLRRDFTPDDILNAGRFCSEAGVAVLFDLLLGSPGETRESIIRTIDLMRHAEPAQVGVALGVRVYPGTELASLVKREALKPGLSGGNNLAKPLFFMEPAVASFASELLDQLIGDDKRFFFFDPSRPSKNYNYNANQVLVEAIRNGHRGAYWDILRKLVQ
jgi:radical SAM superfamily enzyme YgiQ (UPF0313 family)